MTLAGCRPEVNLARLRSRGWVELKTKLVMTISIKGGPSPKTIVLLSRVSRRVML